MKIQELSSNIWLWLVMSFLPLLMAQSVRAEVKQNETTAITTIKRLSEIERPATNVSELFSQSSTPSSEVVQVTAVKANPTAKGVEVILQTTKGQQLQVKNRSTGNSFIADIPNAQLRLPNGDGFTFRSEKPIAGVTEITVTNFDANTIRVTAIGEASSPTVELFDSDEGLIFGLTTAASIAQQPPQTQTTPQVEQPTNPTQPKQPSAPDNQPIELVVTGEQDGYSVPDATTATKTGTPLRDIPQSIQVVPQQVLRDQQVTRLNDALRNVPGVISSFGSDVTSETSQFTIRGFATSDTLLKNGLADPLGARSLELSNIDRVEVLKGPASALFGNGSPGGTVNLITKQPLATPYYAVEATVGSDSYYRGAVDLSGPLNDDKTALYRLNVSYKDAGSFIDFAHGKNLLIAPVLSFAIDDRTKLSLEGEYISADTNRLSLPAVGTVLPNPNGEIPRNLNTSGPNSNDNYVHESISRIGYSLEHKFSDNWSLKNAFRATFYDFESSAFYATSLDPDDRTLNRIFNQAQFHDEAYNMATDIIGKFSTGSIQHQLLFGFDLSRFDYEYVADNFAATPIDLFNPVYNQPIGPSLSHSNGSSLIDALGIYIQDQIALSQNLKLLLGVRFDAFKETDGDLVANTESIQSGDAFSPRFGIVYQPLPPISLYASYSQSFTPSIGTSFDGSTFEPERGTQYEVGVKADLNERISTTLAFYNLTRSNVLTQDPNNPDFSIQTGEQRSRGIEFNIGGEILKGLNVIAGYAYTDAIITKDNTYTPGNLLNNVPKNSFNLWTKYEIQSGSLKGLGFGLGLFYIGEREGDLENSFQLPSYVRTDAAIFYKQGQLRAQLNFRNLFNVDYFESADNILRVYPGEPFTVQGTISWEL
ncbi:MAG: TonB-dependent siderophore receptor [Nostoc sp.]|uniref:TonB-dependent siderophore receptor n=1 Tax=Nostoc sp. TaxID=1180 RepID=UPI002FF8D704